MLPHTAALLTDMIVSKT